MLFKVSGWPVLGHFLCFKNIVFVKVTFLTRIEERVLIHSCASSSLDRSFSISYLFIFGCAGSSLLHGLFSSCGKWGYSSCGTQALIALVSLFVEHGLSGMQTSLAAAPKL